jgi:predicted phosphodiesterase
MRVAALYDIHGNLPALEAVLGEIEQAQVDRVVVGGDVAPGPQSGACLDRLLELGIPLQFIQGNGEFAVLAQMTGQNIERIPEQAREIIRWEAQQIGPKYERLIASWPATLAVAIPPLGEVLFCHATPRNNTEMFTRLTPEDVLRPVFDGVTASIVVCGHTHMQFDRSVGGIRIVNAGSVGMPFGEPGAYWLLLGPDVQLRRTAYDLSVAAKRVADTNYPQADEFGRRYILQPPTESQMLDVFGRAELR